MESELFLYKKSVDWSTLHYGISIPVDFHNIFLSNFNGILHKGESKNVTMMLNETEYTALLINQNFDKTKYPTHKDIIQIRYSSNSAIAKALRDIFRNTYDYLLISRNTSENKNKIISIPSNLQEFLIIYYSSVKHMLIIESIVKSDIEEVQQMSNNYSEYEFEQLMNIIDSNATLVDIERFVKVRKLDRIIGDQLKKIYEYKCQVCGIHIGGIYGTNLIHTHHIEYFSKSLNNDVSNLMVICPNHHGIIHDVNPAYDKNIKAFIFNNGYIEKLKVNLHL